MALPTIIIEGATIVADPELRFTPNGKPVVNFRVASNSRRFNRETNEWEDGDATFLTCNLWGDAAQNVADSVHKGTRVNVTGRLKQRQYQTKDGQDRTVFEVEVQEVGPSLKFATAQVTKSNGGGGQAAAPQQDPWNSAPERGGFAPQDSEPPF